METKQASDLDNIVIGFGGRYVRNRYGSLKLNATELGTAADTFPVTGIGVLNLSNQSSYILALKKGKAFSCTLGQTGLTFTDRTGAVTITNQTLASDERVLTRWSLCQHNDLLIGFGGNINSPDAPFKWAGAANNLAALGGSPPSAAFGFSANNRVFACRTAANRTLLQWSVLGNPEDWTGTGSGSTTIGTLNDASGPITAVALLPQNILLVFKPTTTYQVSLVSAPFPQYLLFDDAGAIPDSAVTVDGKVYFLTMKNKAMVTDGDRLDQLPPLADNLLQNIANGNGDQYSVHGFRRRGVDFDWVCWSIWNPTGSSAYTVAWDMNNKCWLRFSTGWNFISSAVSKQNYFYGGYYNQGFLFGPEYSIGQAGDDTSENSGQINSFWRSGWMTQNSSFTVTQIQNIMLGLSVGLSGGQTALAVKYGFNFIPDQNTVSLSQSQVSTETETTKTFVTTGNGNGFQYYFGQNGAAARYKVNRVWIGGKSPGQKALAA